MSALRARGRNVIVAACVSFACDAPEPPAPTPTPAKVTAPELPSAKTSPSELAATPIGLFTGVVDLAALPLHDVDPGVEFDAGLRNRIAPPERGGAVPRIRRAP